MPGIGRVGASSASAASRKACTSEVQLERVATIQGTLPGNHRQDVAGQALCQDTGIALRPPAVMYGAQHFALGVEEGEPRPPSAPATRRRTRPGLPFPHPPRLSWRASASPPALDAVLESFRHFEGDVGPRLGVSAWAVRLTRWRQVWLFELPERKSRSASARAGIRPSVCHCAPKRGSFHESSVAQAHLDARGVSGAPLGEPPGTHCRDG